MLRRDTRAEALDRNVHSLASRSRQKATGEALSVTVSPAPAKSGTRRDPLVASLIFFRSKSGGVGGFAVSQQPLLAALKIQEPDWIVRWIVGGIVQEHPAQPRRDT